MPIECLVAWIIALHDDREETAIQEELIQEGGKKREKNGRKEKKQTKERAQKKGKECENTPTQYKNRTKNRKDKKGQGNRLLGANPCTRTTKAHRRYRDHLWTFAVYRSPVDV
jgi:hypothetical protein